jgi:hypothetical protein
VASLTETLKDDLTSPDAVILRETYFHKSAISQERVKQFLKTTTISESSLAEKIKASSTRPGDDFTIPSRIALLLFSSFRRTLSGDGSLRKLTYVRQGAGTAVTHLYPARYESEGAFSFERICSERKRP